MYIICSNFLVVVLLWSWSYNLWASDIQLKLRFELLNKHSNEQGLERLELENRLKYTWKSEEEEKKSVSKAAAL